jgi:maltooligosyltrehalose trehalohydrolase
VRAPGEAPSSLRRGGAGPKTPSMQRPVAPAGSDRLTRGRARGEVTRDVTFEYDAGPQRDVGNVRLQGSWNKSGRYSAEWGNETIPMRYAGNGRWTATVRLVDDAAHSWEWGVYADTPAKKNAWVVHAGKNLTFDPASGSAAYAPTTYHLMGARKGEAGELAFRVWLPQAHEVTVRITSRDGKVTRFPLQRTGDDWSVSLAGAFSRFVGASYMYEITDSRGESRVIPDPYAFEVTGEQFGLSRAWFDPQTGAETHQYLPSKEFMRFELRDDDNASQAWVVLKDAAGHALDKAQVEAVLGELDPALRSAIAAGRGIDDLASIDANGRLVMRYTDGTWTTLVHNVQALEGLRYHFTTSSGRYVTDPWTTHITKDSGVSFRDSVIVDAVRPVTRPATPPVPWNEAVICQIHVGSFFSSAKNSRRSTFADVCDKLDYLQWLGVNALELLPVTEEQGVRGWGYAMGVVNFATESGLGFVHEGTWVSGREALAMLRTEMTKRRMNLVADVVYNHALDKNNPLADIDPANPYYNWGSPEQPTLRKTPWGPMPAFNNPRVRQFLVDHAVAQVLEHGFDGLRLDFTQPIYHEGGPEGRAFLVELVEQIREVAPQALIIPEDFSYEPWIVELMGSLWYTEFQHRLVHDHNPDRPGLVQAAANGKFKNVDAFLKLMTSPLGLRSLTQAIVMISNHDEVGNAKRTVMVAQGAEASSDPPQWARDVSRAVMLIGLMSPGIPFFFQGDESLATNNFLWGRPSTWDLGWTWFKLGKTWDWDRLRFDDGMRATYERLFTLGEAAEQDPEFVKLAEADKKVYRDLARMSTQERATAFVDMSRKLATALTRNAIGLRKAKSSLLADVPAQPVYAHNDDGVLAFSRGKERAEHVVIANISKQDRRGYRIPLPPGKFRLVMNSDDVHYGGRGFTADPGVVEGSAAFDLAAGGALVLERLPEIR